MGENAEPRRLALWDRDATIIVDEGYLKELDRDGFAWGAIEGLRMFPAAGFVLPVIPDQSGVHRGFFDAGTVSQIHPRLQSLLAAEGLALDAIYICPNGPGDHCGCRKPGPGMAQGALRDLAFCRSRAVAIGDSVAEMQAAATAGVMSIRVASSGECGGTEVTTDFPEAARRACTLFANQDAGEPMCT